MTTTPWVVVYPLGPVSQSRTVCNPGGQGEVTVLDCQHRGSVSTVLTLRRAKYSNTFKCVPH